MPLPIRSSCAGLLFVVFMGTAHAADPAPLRTELTLTHIATDKWRADYVFAEPVTAIELGPQIGTYRKQAWRLLTNGVDLVVQDNNESLRSNKPLTQLSVEISRYSNFELDQYAPINHFSDGGADFYLGFLYGSLGQSEHKRDMAVTLHLQGLTGETVLAPSKPGADLAGYAYFGPSKPARMGNANVIIDPLAPAWLRDTIADTTAKVSQFYEQAFQRKLTDTPLISVAMIGFDGEPGSISIKGGVVGGGVVYRLQGRGLMEDHPKRRAFMAGLVAHEMAHVWQNNLARGGIGENDPWIHEGGAEAIMLEAMRATGIFTEEMADQYAQKLLKECDDLKDDVTIYRGFYACGFKRFNSYPMAPVPLWRAMLTRSEDSDESYSESMIQAILREQPATQKAQQHSEHLQ
ncbi:hypothetical protein HPT27_11920 [Permianibacter sp. IMCC34836]|uniref:hypothetical protein n=1 Tax=Permianibacter fluminis TaxID=2738515 RepID=UPI001555F9B2|nr:hypothetical protein [Permianibacter fluminis]NQD37734.1 hypothetical protein [Permianibacter fluminis]